MASQTSIFVSIANYRDSETPHTVADLLAQASFPQRVQVGVWSQVMPGMDNDCLAPDHPQVRQRCVPASESEGVCWARHRVLTELREDERYVLQIDSHSRFAPGWDQRFIEMLAQCPSPKPVLTCYPSAYVPPRQLGVPLISVPKARAFSAQGVLTFDSRTMAYAARPSAPIPCAFVGAGCLFAAASAFDEVPYDPWLYFHGEEVTLAARLWTHGWDFFAPNDVLMYHDYTHDRGRPKHWDDHRDWSLLNARSFSRIRHLLTGAAAPDPLALQDLNNFGLGEARSLDDYMRFAGVDFAQRLIHAP